MQRLFLDWCTYSRPGRAATEQGDLLLLTCIVNALVGHTIEDWDEAVSVLAMERI